MYDYIPSNYVRICYISLNHQHTYNFIYVRRSNVHIQLCTSKQRLLGALPCFDKNNNL